MPDPGFSVRFHSPLLKLEFDTKDMGFKKKKKKKARWLWLCEDEKGKQNSGSGPVLEAHCTGLHEAQQAHVCLVVTVFLFLMLGFVESH